MKRVRALLVVALFLAAARGAGAADTAQISPQPNAQEAQFVESISKDLQARFGTTMQAAKAGFVRFNNEDKSGAISWANGKWTSVDQHHPSQLWYDVHGRLIGADYSVRVSDSPKPPELWGVDPRRWDEGGAHVHYGLKQPDGTIKYGGIGQARLAKGGGSVVAPTKQMLVNAGVAKSAADVAFVIPFPHMWDLQVWVIPNANGAFAELNPSVKPANAAPMKM